MLELNIKELNNEKVIALDILKSGNNCFVTGDAGTGKSFLIDAYIDYLKRDDYEYAVLAPTGLAALNVGGITLHRFFQLPTYPLTPTYKLNNEIIKLVNRYDVIIIDEISMVRVDTFHTIARYIEEANAIAESENEPTTQLIVVGDLFQLDPVATPTQIAELNKNKKFEDRTYAFESTKWNKFKFINIELKEIKRQDGASPFAKMLNCLRRGSYLNECVTFLNNNKSEYNENALHLYATNKKVDTHNDKMLAKLDTEENTYYAEIVGTVKDSDKPCPETLTLKIGARVMACANDNIDELFVNGQMGTVEKLSGNCVYVLFDGDEEPTKIEPKEFQILIPPKKKGKKPEVIGWYTQIPLRLAFAATIHKSQGQTYDQVMIDPYCFAFGQFYVAMSRVKTLEGLHLLQPAQTRFIHTSPKVYTFYENLHKK